MYAWYSLPSSVYSVVDNRGAMFKALVIDSDQKDSSSYCSFLNKQGYSTTPAFTFANAREILETSRIDVVVCNMVVEGYDGALFVESARDVNPHIPIIVVSAQGDFRTKQRAFLAGCDDFMIAPVDLNELELRIAALLRRSQSVSKRRIVVGNAVLDSDSLSVVEGSRSVVLPPKEFMVLFKLCTSPGRVFSRRDIMDDIWDIQTESGERTVDVHIKRLRRRFEDSESFRIETVRGVGYKVTV